jgi:hypothetical protein
VLELQLTVEVLAGAVKLRIEIDPLIGMELQK